MISPTSSEPYRETVAEIEGFSRRLWNDLDVNHVDLGDPGRDSKFVVGMFPYPSGSAHLGHMLVYTLVDVVARLGRFNGAAVFNPLGWDSFGLPAENAAIKNNIDPQIWTQDNISVMRDQLHLGGFSFDLAKEIDTSSPQFYKWTQWLFLKLLEHGYVYRSDAWVNWDPVDQTVLANEQVIDGRGWRSGAMVERRRMPQWYIRITAFAEQLYQGLDSLDGWSDRAINAQRAWIGRAEGAELDFRVADGMTPIRVFTDRVDLAFGVVAVVLAPECSMLDDLVVEAQRPAVDAFLLSALRKSEVERQTDGSGIGVFTGSFATNPANGERVPIFIGEYVIPRFGAEAIMCVPAHNQADHDFAIAQRLPVDRIVVQGAESDGLVLQDGVLVASEQFNGLSSADARTAIMAAFESTGSVRPAIRYRLRDWSVSRQRFWGCPIPVRWLSDTIFEPVDHSELPVLLPSASTWVGRAGRDLPSVDSHASEAQSVEGGGGFREADTMDTFMCSAWYVWRFLAAKDEQEAWSPDVAAKWMPLDCYVGGLEHANQHLIYFRFMSYFVHSIGLSPTQEPVRRFLDNGLIKMAGAKMSKSKGNVVSPATVIQDYGADALRLYLLSDTPFDRDREWDEAGVAAKQNFLAQIAQLLSSADQQLDLRRLAQRPTADDAWSVGVLANLYRACLAIRQEVEVKGGFHVAVARIHALTSDMREMLAAASAPNRELIAVYCLQSYLKILGVFAPHLAEWCWQKYFGASSSLFTEAWPEVDTDLLSGASAVRSIPVTLGGKKRLELEVRTVWSDDEIKAAALQGSVASIDRQFGMNAVVDVYVVRNKLGEPRLVNLVPRSGK
jgi:leucyl-tRNA synthetase